MRSAAVAARWRSLRLKLRNDDLFLICLAVLAGFIPAGRVIAMRELVSLLHQIFYGVGREEDALQRGTFVWWRAFVVLGLGGLVYGVVAFLIRRVRKQDPIDVIEANALHGGVLSLKDGFLIALQTVGAVGLGASVGLEAGVSQLDGALASWFGQQVHLSRASLRTMVGCGAAAAIAALFNAPIAGMFYALEL